MTLVQYTPILGAVLGVVVCVAFIAACSRACDAEHEASVQPRR